MTGEQQVYKDGQLNFLGGADSLTHPILLAENRVSFGNNVAFRGGFCDQRPGYKQLGVTFDRDSTYDWIIAGTLQGRGVYYNGDKVENIILVSGRLFSIDLITLECIERTPKNNTSGYSASNIPAIGATIDVTFENVVGLEIGHPIFIDEYEYTITARTDYVVTIENVDDIRAGQSFGGRVISHLVPNVSFLGQCWMLQADKYFIIQDGISSAIILDGPHSRRPVFEQSEVPTGKQMAYGRGRIWIATGENEVKAGDIIGGTTGILRFTENDYLNEGGAFKIPDSEGPITAMQFINTLDDSLGQGPLLVSTTKAIFSLNAPTDRDTWKNLTDPIQTYALLNYGSESQDSTVLVNGDMFYRSKDGIRSFVLARRDFGTWGNVPVSSEMQGIISDDSEKLLNYSSAILFDNRLLFTVNPRLFRNGAYHMGLGSLDFSPISSMGQKSAPAYDMLWTGIKPATIFKATINNEDRAFVWALNDEKHYELWEITKSGEFDNEDGRIKSYIETGAKSFGNPYELKRLTRAELFVDSVKGDVDFTIRYKPDGYACWIEWGSFSLCQQYRQCSTDEACNDITSYQPGYRNRIKLSEPSNTEINSPVNPARDFYTVQIRIEWTGRARLLRYLLAAEQTVEDIGYPDDD